MRTTTITTMLATLVVAATALTGCTASNQEPSAALVVHDPWVKAIDEGMTGAFATLENTTDETIQITAAATTAAGMTELHETVDGTMREVESFTIEAGEEFELEPGGDHIMLMGVTQAIKPGDEITITLTLNDGSQRDIVWTAKDFTGANESYEPSH